MDEAPASICVDRIVGIVVHVAAMDPTYPARFLPYRPSSPLCSTLPQSPSIKASSSLGKASVGQGFVLPPWDSSCCCGLPLPLVQLCPCHLLRSMTAGPHWPLLLMLGWDPVSPVPAFAHCCLQGWQMPSQGHKSCPPPMSSHAP